MKKKTVKKTKGRRNEETKKRRNKECSALRKKKQRRISERTEGQETTQWAYDPNQVSQSDQWLLPLTEFKLLSATDNIN